MGGGGLVAETVFSERGRLKEMWERWMFEEEEIRCWVL
jgi:hypothetical protein